MQRQAPSNSASSAGGSGGSTGTPGHSSGSPSSAQDPYVRSLTALESDLLEKLHELQLLTAENQQLTQRYTQLELQVGISSQQLLHIARTCQQAEAAPNQPPEAPATQSGSGSPPDQQTTLDAAASTAEASTGSATAAAAAAAAAPAAQTESEGPGLELGALQRVLQHEEQVQQLLESIGAALPQLGAGAIQLKDLLAGLDLGGATSLTLEELAAAHKAFVQQASLLLHSAGDLAGGATPELRQLVSQHLRLLMAASTAQPLLIWRMASLDLESGQPADMMGGMYRYVLLNTSLSWEQLDWLAGAYARHEPRLAQLTAQRVELLEALAAATATGDAASEAEAVAAVQANVRQWNHVQSSIMVHLAAVSCWGQVARLLVSSYPQFPLAIYVSKAARDLFQEITGGQQGPAAAAGPSTASARTQWAAMCAAAMAGTPSK